MDEKKVNLANYRKQKAEDELKSAKYLLEKEIFTSSLSSSYYAIFHSIRILFAFEGIDSKTHRGVTHLFNKHFVKQGLLPKKLNSIISGALEMRLDSDYEDFYMVSKKETKEQMENAEKFMNEIIEFVKKHYKVEL